MTNQIPETILAKVKKCLALAAGNGNEAEAATALRQAKKLMQMYGVTSTDLEFSEIVEHPHDVRTHLMTRWQQDLVTVVCRIFGITSITRYGKRVKQVVFIGSKSNVELADYLFDVLQRQLKHDRNEYHKALCASSFYAPLRELCREHGIRWSATKAGRTMNQELEAFTIAWVVRVNDRCEHMFSERPQVIRKYMEENYSDIGELKPKKTDLKALERNGAAIRAGFHKAEKAQILVGVNAAQERAALPEK